MGTRALITGSATVLLLLATPACAAERPVPAPVVPAAHDGLGRALDELAAQLDRLGARWREHFEVAPAERPLISLALEHRAELGLTAAQVDALEQLRRDFQREAIRRDADLRVADMDLRALLAAEPLDLVQAEAKMREIERLRADLRVARLRTLEQGRAVLTPEQRERLRALLGDPGPADRPRAGGTRLRLPSGSVLALPGGPGPGPDRL